MEVFAMSEFKLPLSGDVTQAINPWTWISRAGTNQFGFFNVNMGTSSDPQMEQDILDRVGTYGKQLGQIGDALLVLVDHAKSDRFSEAERKMLMKFRLQLEAIKDIKAERRSEP
jgi:hypothetical protein